MNFKRNLRQIAKLCSAIAAFLFAGFVSFAAHAATVTYPQSFATGWNLAGNSLSTAIDVKTTFGAQAGIVTLWKWDAAGSKWAFYAPSLDTAGTLASYAATKGYTVLTTINQGEGYWVNASTPVSLGTASGTGFSLATANLATGWNLAATGDNIAPATFTTNVGNVTTLWAWDNVNGAWYFYAPTLAANSTLASYITGKGYKDFGALTLGNGRGFWVNYAGSTAGAVGGTTGGTSTSASGNYCVADIMFSYGSYTSHNPVCYINLPGNFSCNASTLDTKTQKYVSLFVNSGTPNIAYTLQSSCPTLNLMDTVAMGGTTSGTGAAIKTATWSTATAIQTTGRQVFSSQYPPAQVKFDASGNAFAYWSKDGDPVGSNTGMSFTPVVARYNTANGTWGAEYALPTTTYRGGAFDLAVNASGDAVAIWFDQLPSGSNHVMSSRYSASSSSWSTPIDLQTKTPGDNVLSIPRVILADNGTAIVMWTELSATYVAAVSSASTWTVTPVAGRYDMWNNMIVDKAGNITVVWAGGSVHQMNAIRYIAASKSWEKSATTIATPTSTADYFSTPSLTVDVNGNVLAVWGYDSGSTSASPSGKVFAAEYSTANNTWGSAVQLDSMSSFGGTGSFTGLNIKVKFDATGNATAVWHHSDSSALMDVVAARFNASTGSWSSLAGTKLIDYAGFNYEIDTTGNVFAIGSQHKVAAQGAKMARYDVGSNTWKPVPANGISQGSQIAFDPVGNAIVALGDRGAIYNVGDNTWSVIHGADAILSVQPSYYPSLVMGPNGTAISLWLDASSRNLVTAQTIKLQ